jgi:hypothetical protein
VIVTPTRARLGWPAAAGVGVALVVLAFAVAPRACAGGLDLYVEAGLVALAVLVAVPWVARIGRSTARRCAWSLALVVLGVVTWVAALLLANVRFICGLGYL